MKRALLIPIFLSACTAEAPVEAREFISTDQASESSDYTATTAAPTAAAAGPSAEYYIVTRQDFRKCAWPMCGGVYVAAVNERKTTCPDGSKAAECYIAAEDLSATGLAESQQYDATADFEAGTGLMLGELAIVTDATGNLEVPTLVASEAWRAATSNPPSGDFFAVDNTGIVCITHPCPSYEFSKLNSRRNWSGAEVDLQSASGASDAEALEGFEALGDEGRILAAGDLYRVSGPAGRSQGLLATEFYLPYTASPCTVDADCASGSWCGWADDNQTQTCKPFVGEGESCGGFVLPSYYERCAPGFFCQNVEPTGDVPGICTAN